MANPVALDPHPGEPAAPRADGAGRRFADPDDALIRRIAAGDDAAWAALVERHLAAVVAFAWHMLGSRAEAEDVAQETFVRLLRKIAVWQSGGPKLRTWLTRVARNLCIDRHRARRHVALDEAADQPDPLTDGGNLDRRLDLAHNVSLALDALPARQRLAVTLVHYQGHTNGEAAALLEVSVDALESLLARGRRTLRHALRPLVGDLLGL